MGFKMKKMNFGKGTGSVNGLPKRGASLNVSDPAYVDFARRVRDGEAEWSDHPDYNPNYEYDKYGNPIATNIRIPNYNKDLLEFDKFAERYEGTPSHIYGTIDTFDQTGQKSYQLRDGKFLERDDFQSRIDKAKSKYYKAEQKHGVGNVTRGDMTNLDFDILLNYGGGEDGTSSWIQERQIAASRGQLDNEPHIVGTDAMMYPDLKEGEVPSLRQMQKNFRNVYQNVMSSTANMDDSMHAYNKGKLDPISNRDAMKLAKDLIPSHSLTSTPTSIHDPASFSPGLTDEQEDAEVKEVEKEMESEEFKELANKPTVEIENDKKLEKETSGEEEDKKQLEGDYNNDGVVDYLDKRMGPPRDERKEPPPTDDAPPADDDSSTSGLEGDYNNDGVVDYLDKRFAPMNKKITGNPFQYGTDSYYKYQKEQRSKNLGLTKRPLNIHGRI